MVADISQQRLAQVATFVERVNISNSFTLNALFYMGLRAIYA